MPLQMTGSHIFVGPGDYAYKVASNFTNYFELGVKDSPEYYLEADIKSGEFLISGHFWTQSGSPIELRDSFPITSDLVRETLPNGYLISDPAGLEVLGIEVSDHVCSIRGQVYSKDGKKIAESSGDDFLVYTGPAVIGRVGDARGIVIN